MKKSGCVLCLCVRHVQSQKLHDQRPRRHTCPASVKVAALSAKWTQMRWAREHKTTAGRVYSEALLFLFSSSFFPAFFFLVFCDVASVNVIGWNWSVQDPSLSQVDGLPQRGVVCTGDGKTHSQVSKEFERSCRLTSHGLWTDVSHAFPLSWSPAVASPQHGHAGCRGPHLPWMNIMKEWSLCSTPLRGSYTQGHWWGLKGRLWVA